MASRPNEKEGGFAMTEMRNRILAGLESGDTMREMGESTTKLRASDKKHHKTPLTKCMSARKDTESTGGPARKNIASLQMIGGRKVWYSPRH